MTKKAARHETPWQRDVQLAIGARPDIVIWRQPTGMWCPPYKPNVFLQGAPTGWPDIMGFQVRRYEVTVTKNPNGFTPVDVIENRFYAQVFGVECKTDVGRQNKDQIQAEKIFRAHYAIYILCPLERWDLLWAALGEEPDEDCAEEADRLRRELGIGGVSAEQQPGPVSGAGRQKGRRA